MDIFQIPLPEKPEDFDSLTPHVDRWEYLVRYYRSLAEYTPFFAALTNKKFFVSYCEACPYWDQDYVYGTPRPGLACMYCGRKCKWREIEPRGVIHSFTKCYFASEMFRDEVPFILIAVEFPGVQTKFLTQLKGAKLEQPDTDNPEILESWIKSVVGKPVKAEFRKLIEPKKMDPTDVWFVPDGWTM